MDKVEELIEQLKSEDAETRWSATKALMRIGEPAVPALIEALKDNDDYLWWGAAKALRKIGEPGVAALIGALENTNVYVQWRATEALELFVERCETIEDLEEFEKAIDEGSVALRKKRVDKRALIDVQIKIARLTRKIAKKKDELAPKRDLLLDDKPKPPKKGRGVYQVSRRVRNK